MKLIARIERWPVTRPVAITGHVFDALDLLFVRVEDGPLFGRGEAYGVYYLSETAATMLVEVEEVRAAVEAGIDRTALQELLPAGGARAALDAALWELESQRTGRAVADLAGVAGHAPVVTTRTIWAGSATAMGAEAALHRTLPALKLKLLGGGEDAARVAAVRAAAPAVRLLVDANQGLDREGYAALLPPLVAARVELIEQPFPVDRDDWLDGLERPIPVAADESAQGLADVAALPGRYDVVNIKLDKCGGLTEGLAMAAEGRRLGLDVMVGCMMATSLSMAPAAVLARAASIADIDGPLYLARDRPHPVAYRDGRVTVPDALWGPRGAPWDAAA